MSDSSRHITTSDGRHRVAYEMALSMWQETKEGYMPKIEDQDEFLALVKKCTSALVHRDG